MWGHCELCGLNYSPNRWRGAPAEQRARTRAQVLTDAGEGGGNVQQGSDWVINTRTGLSQSEIHCWVTLCQKHRQLTNTQLRAHTSSTTTLKLKVIRWDHVRPYTGSVQQPLSQLPFNTPAIVQPQITACCRPSRWSPSAAHGWCSTARS